MKKSKKLMILGLSAATAAVAATGAVSSFAWFALRDSVTATGMVIKASSKQVFLQINTENTWTSTEDNAYSSAAALTTSAQTITATHPVTTWDETKKSVNVDADGGMATYAKDSAGTGAPAWVSATSKTDTSATKDTDRDYSNVSTAANTASSNDANNGYTLLNSFYLRLRPASGGDTQPSVKKLTASVEWATTPTVSAESTSDNIAKSVRVLVYNETDKCGTVYKPVSDSSSTSALTAAWVEDNTNLLGSTTATSGWSAKSETNWNARTVRVYVYFDGEDSNCFTKNIKVDNTYSVKVNFTVSDIVA